MKLAVCLSGQPRFLDGPQIHSLKQNLLDKYDCDVYCHTWWSPDLPSYETSYNGVLQAKADTIDTLQHVFRPKRLQYEAPLQNLPHPSNMRSMYESIRRSYLLVDTSINYDFIVRLRYDIFLDALPDVHKFEPTMLHCAHIAAPRNLFVNHCWFVPPQFARDAFQLIDHIRDNETRIEEKIFEDAIRSRNIPMKQYSRSIFSSTRFRTDRIYRGFSEEDFMTSGILFISIVILFILVTINLRKAS